MRTYIQCIFKELFNTCTWRSVFVKNKLFWRHLYVIIWLEERWPHRRKYAKTNWERSIPKQRWRFTLVSELFCPLSLHQCTILLLPAYTANDSVGKMISQPHKNYLVMYIQYKSLHTIKSTLFKVKKQPYLAFALFQASKRLSKQYVYNALVSIVSHTYIFMRMSVPAFVVHTKKINFEIVSYNPAKVWFVADVYTIAVCLA